MCDCGGWEAYDRIKNAGAICCKSMRDQLDAANAEIARLTAELERVAEPRFHNDDHFTITESGLQALRESRLKGEVKAGCIDHPDAPHGYDRNASHDAGEYRCLCDSWASGDSE